MIDNNNESRKSNTITANTPIKYTPNQIAYIALREQGLNAHQAAKELGLSNGYPNYIDKKINKRFDLCDTKLVKGAHKTIKNLSQGLPVGTIEKVKDSTALAAAGMIYERYQPVKSQDNQSVSNNYTQVNIHVHANSRDVSTDCQTLEDNTDTLHNTVNNLDIIE